MPSGTPNPNPSRTVWTIIALVIALVLLTGYLTIGDHVPGPMHLTTQGGLLPAVFVAIAIIVGVICVGIFLHRGDHHRH